MDKKTTDIVTYLTWIGLVVALVAAKIGMLQNFILIKLWLLCYFHY